MSARHETRHRLEFLHELSVGANNLRTHGVSRDADHRSGMVIKKVRRSTRAVRHSSSPDEQPVVPRQGLRRLAELQSSSSCSEVSCCPIVLLLFLPWPSRPFTLHILFSFVGFSFRYPSLRPPPLFHPSHYLMFFFFFFSNPPAFTFRVSHLALLP